MCTSHHTTPQQSSHNTKSHHTTYHITPQHNPHHTATLHQITPKLTIAYHNVTHHMQHKTIQRLPMCTSHNTTPHHTSTEFTTQHHISPHKTTQQFATPHSNHIAPCHRSVHHTMPQFTTSQYITPHLSSQQSTRIHHTTA